jgi:hypothetical protein
MEPCSSAQDSRQLFSLQVISKVFNPK